MKQIAIWKNVDRNLFEKEILPKNKPAILKGLVDNWPSVVEAKKSDEAIIAYLNKYDNGERVPVLVGPASIKGRFSYQDDLKRYNFVRRVENLPTVLSGILELKGEPNPEAVSAQGLDIDKFMPGFSENNAQTLIDKPEVAKAWIGNKTITATHYDHVENIACVVAGRRRFTLFPPEQLPNLYVGPLFATPAGPPISMVDLKNPDYSKFPRFEKALMAGYQADLEPGDAIFIPYLWWHNVESLSEFNLLVNFWWAQYIQDPKTNTPYHCMLFSMMSIPDLPEEHRKIWKEFFNHYVFQLDGRPADHLTAEIDDIISGLSQERKDKLKKMLLAGTI